MDLNWVLIDNDLDLCNEIIANLTFIWALSQFGSKQLIIPIIDLLFWMFLFSYNIQVLVASIANKTMYERQKSYQTVQKHRKSKVKKPADWSQSL